MKSGVVLEECYPFNSSSGNAPKCFDKCTGTIDYWHRFKMGGYYTFSTEKAFKQEIF